MSKQFRNSGSEVAGGGQDRLPWPVSPANHGTNWRREKGPSWDSQAGFTLAETLVALAVMLLVSLCMCVGVNFAAKSYASSVATSEAKTLCSTLTAEVTSELAYTTAIDVSADGTLVGYFSPTWGNGEGASAGSGTTSLTTTKSQFTLMTTDASGAATYVPAASAPATTTGQLAVNSNKLVSSALYTHGLTASISVAYVGASGTDTQAGSLVGHFAITICIYDSAGVEVARSCFDVTALNLAQVSLIG